MRARCGRSCRTLYRDLPEETLEARRKRILRIPSLPPQLAPDALDALPETPGVYLFYGDNPLPLYIGKSVNLRERVAAHFSSDWRSETDLRLSQEIRRIDFEETAGELGALLREATLVKSRMPAHNRALRRKAEAGVLTLTQTGTPAYVSRGGDRARRARRRLRTVPVARERARSIARAGGGAPAVLAAAGARTAPRWAVLPATAAALRGSVRRRGGPGGARRAARRCARTVDDSFLAASGHRARAGEGGILGARRRARDPQLVLARHRPRRWRARFAAHGAAAAAVRHRREHACC
jgi:hypothetical protein